MSQPGPGGGISQPNEYNQGMKIRTITTGFNAELPLDRNHMRQLAAATLHIRRMFQEDGLTVQTVRMVTQPWEQYCPQTERLAEAAVEMEELLHPEGIDYFSLGATRNARHVPGLYDIIQNTRAVFVTVAVSHGRRLDKECARQSARLIKRLSGIGGDGFANLRFAAGFNIPPGTPFFPAAYHDGPPAFALGLENSDLVYESFSRAGDLQQAGTRLEELLNREYRPLEKRAREAAARFNLIYGGIDVSIAPSVKRHQSVAFAFERLGLGRFGEPGTLCIAERITDVLGRLRVKTCGYSGLMLPVLEDFGLARRNREGHLNVSSLLAYSAVCGTGLDTIPLPGRVSEKALYALLLDIAALSNRLDKPLSARLMPIPGKKAGDLTEFSFPYFANTRIMPLTPIS